MTKINRSFEKLLKLFFEIKERSVPFCKNEVSIYIVPLPEGNRMYLPYKEQTVPRAKMKLVLYVKFDISYIAISGAI